MSNQLKDDTLEIREHKQQLSFPGVRLVWQKCGSNKFRRLMEDLSDTVIVEDHDKKLFYKSKKDEKERGEKENYNYFKIPI